MAPVQAGLMGKANYIIIYINTIDELKDFPALANRVKSILEVAHGFGLSSPYDDTQKYLDDNHLDILEGINKELDND